MPTTFLTSDIGEWLAGPYALTPTKDLLVEAIYLPYGNPPFNFHLGTDQQKRLVHSLVWFQLPNGLTVSCLRAPSGLDEAFMFRSDVEIDEEGEAVAVADGFTDFPLVFFDDVPLLLSFVLTVAEWPTATLLVA